MRNMVVSDHAHNGRHLRSLNTTGFSYDSLFVDLRISDILVSLRESPTLAGQGQQSYRKTMKWELMYTNSSGNRISPHRSILNREAIMSGENLFYAQDEIVKHVSSVNDEMKDHISVMKINVDNKLSNIEDEMKKVKETIKPLEDKLDHLTRLLERVLAL